MTKYEIDIPDPSRHPLTDFPDDIKSLLQLEMSKLRGAIPTEVILGSEIHGLALTDAFNSAAPNNRNIIPLITRHSSGRYPFSKRSVYHC